MPSGRVYATGGRLVCTRCGYDGVPSFWGGRALLECPRCEHEAFVDPIPRPPAGCHWAIRRRQERARVPRNAPCPCGSGAKAKKCHPAWC